MKNEKPITPIEFEEIVGKLPHEAAEMLGITYPRWMEYRRGARPLKPYHHASINAHVLLHGQKD